MYTIAADINHHKYHQQMNIYTMYTYTFIRFFSIIQKWVFNAGTWWIVRTYIIDNINIYITTCHHTLNIHEYITHVLYIVYLIVDMKLGASWPQKRQCLHHLRPQAPRLLYVRPDWRVQQLLQTWSLALRPRCRGPSPRPMSLLRRRDGPLSPWWHQWPARILQPLRDRTRPTPPHL